MHAQTVITFNPDDMGGWQTAKNVWFLLFKIFNLLALYIEYILISEHYGQL